MDIARREFRELIYGADSPFSSHTEYETIQGIGREDLLEFHQTFYQPQNTVLGIWGDFDPAEMKKLVRETFGDWKNTGEVPELPEKIDAVQPGTYAVTKPDLVQSVIFLGHLGGKRDNPDFFPLQVMNRILSGGFTSRLFVNVRSTKGLAYSVFGAYASFYDYPGIFYAGCLTKNERAVEAVEAIVHEVNRLKEEKVSEEELQVAKEGFLNSFVFNFDDKGQIIQRMLTYELHGYPLDFLQKTKDEVEKVTREDVFRVAREYLRPEDFRVLVVGNLEPDDPAFEPLGEVSAVDITIPEPTPADELPAPSTEERDES
jgi:zinc protease